MADFDQERALREEITGLIGIQTTLATRTRDLEKQYTEIEVEYNAVKKLLGFANAELGRKREVIKALQDRRLSLSLGD